MSTDDCGVFSTLVHELRRHYDQSKVLQKVLDDTRRVLREIQAASCINQNKEIMDAFTSFNDLPIQLVAEKPPSIIIVGGRCSSRVAVANRLLGVDVLPPPRCGVAWHTLQFVDTDCVSNFSAGAPLANAAGTKTLWSWFNSVPLVDLEVDSCQETGGKANVVSISSVGFESEFTRTVPVVNILMSHQMLRAGCQMVVCDHSCSDAIQFAVSDVIPIIIFVVTGSELSQTDVSLLQLLRQTSNHEAVFFIKMSDGSDVPEKNGDYAEPFYGALSPDIQCQLSSLGFLSSSPDNNDTETSFDVTAVDRESSDEETAPPPRPASVPVCDMSELCEGLESQFTARLTSFVKTVLESRLLSAINQLYDVHQQCLNVMIDSTFVAANDVACTPARLKYAHDQEEKLYRELMEVALKKQSEIQQIIVNAIASERDAVQQLASDFQFDEVISSNPGRPSAIAKECTLQIQKLVLSHLNSIVATRLLGLVDGLRSSCIDVLLRCLESLERKASDGSDQQETSAALKEILCDVYKVELTVFTGQSMMHSVVEKMKLLMRSVLRRTEAHLDDDWRRKVAASILAAFTDSRCKRLAKDVCCQIEDRLRKAHAGFENSMQRLETCYSSRLKQTESHSLSLRKKLAPRIARLALESRSLRDFVVHGKPVMGEELGRGQYGIVYTCESWSGFDRCAVKSVAPPDERHLNDLALEFHYTINIPEHKRIAAVHGSVIDYKYGAKSRRRFPAVLLVMARFKCDLHTAIERRMNWRSRLQVAIDVAEGIRYLHSLGLVHRDIKLNNVLLDFEDRGKLADFGFCKPAAMMSGSVVGTPLHMAPELVTAQYDRSVDVYAFGMLFWFVCAGTVRYPSEFAKCNSVAEFFEKIRKGLRPERPKMCDDDCWLLMQKCWDGTSSSRPHIGELEQSLRVICHTSTLPTTQASAAQDHEDFINVNGHSFAATTYQDTWSIMQ